MNTGRYGPGSFRPVSCRPGSFLPIFRVGCFGLGRWAVSAYFRGESFRPWVVLSKVYRNYYGITGTDGRTLGLVTVF